VCICTGKVQVLIVTFSYLDLMESLKYLLHQSEAQLVNPICWEEEY
jgi:hypothetical protein